MVTIMKIDVYVLRRIQNQWIGVCRCLECRSSEYQTSAASDPKSLAQSVYNHIMELQYAKPFAKFMKNQRGDS